MLQQTDGSWIDARTLHKELKVGKDFTTWIKGKISKYEFVENDEELDSIGKIFEELLEDSFD